MLNKKPTHPTPPTMKQLELNREKLIKETGWVYTHNSNGLVTYTYSVGRNDVGKPDLIFKQTPCIFPLLFTEIFEVIDNNLDFEGKVFQSKNIRYNTPLCPLVKFTLRTTQPLEFQDVAEKLYARHPTPALVKLIELNIV